MIRTALTCLALALLTTTAAAQQGCAIYIPETTMNPIIIVPGGGGSADIPQTPEGAVVGDRYIIEATADGWQISPAPTGFALPAGGTDGQVLVQTVGGGYAWSDLPADIDEVPDTGTPGWFLTKTAGGVAWAAIDLSALDARIQALEEAPGYDDTALSGRVTTIENDVATPFVGDPAVPGTASTWFAEYTLSFAPFAISINGSMPINLTNMNLNQVITTINADSDFTGVTASTPGGNTLLLTATYLGSTPIDVVDVYGQGDLSGIASLPGDDPVSATGVMPRLQVVEAQSDENSVTLTDARGGAASAVLKGFEYSNLDFTNGGANDGSITINMQVGSGQSFVDVVVNYMDVSILAANPSDVTAEEFASALTNVLADDGIAAWASTFNDYGPSRVLISTNGVGPLASITIGAYTQNIGAGVTGLGAGMAAYGQAERMVGTRLMDLEIQALNHLIPRDAVPATMLPASGADLTADIDLSAFAGRTLTVDDLFGNVASYLFTASAAGQAAALEAAINTRGFVASRTPNGLSISRADGVNFRVTHTGGDLSAAVGLGNLSETFDGVRAGPVETDLWNTVEYLLQEVAALKAAP